MEMVKKNQKERKIFVNRSLIKQGQDPKFLQTKISERRRKKVLMESQNFLQVYLLSKQVTPHARCKLRKLKMDRVKDYLLMEQEFIENRKKYLPEKEEDEEEENKIDELRGNPLV